jgi:hypothetical protein
VPPIAGVEIKMPLPPPSSVSAATLAPLHQAGDASPPTPRPHAAGPPKGHRRSPETRHRLETPPHPRSSMPTHHAAPLPSPCPTGSSLSHGEMGENLVEDPTPVGAR